METNAVKPDDGKSGNWLSKRMPLSLLNLFRFKALQLIQIVNTITLTTS